MPTSGSQGGPGQRGPGGADGGTAPGSKELTAECPSEVKTRLLEALAEACEGHDVTYNFLARNTLPHRVPCRRASSREVQATVFTQARLGVVADAAHVRSPAPPPPSPAGGVPVRASWAPHLWKNSSANVLKAANTNLASQRAWIGIWFQALLLPKRKRQPCLTGPHRPTVCWRWGGLAGGALVSHRREQRWSLAPSRPRGRGQEREGKGQWLRPPCSLSQCHIDLWPPPSVCQTGRRGLFSSNHSPGVRNFRKNAWE